MKSRVGGGGGGRNQRLYLMMKEPKNAFFDILYLLFNLSKYTLYMIFE